MTDIKIKEVLYLSKEEDNIIACPMNGLPLPQHQIDGIRFLFAMYKKEKPGVILNDPPGYGKTVQVVCFLNAIRNTLKGPVLVLVKENEMSLWKDHFERYSNFGDDISYEPSYPYPKKAVLVSGRGPPELLSRRPWAVAVLDDGRARPPAAYKVCLLSEDVKDNLYTLASYYQYLYPKEAFDAAAFTPAKGDRKDAVSKALLLDAFLEDVVLRRRDFTPFQKPQTQSPLVNEPPRVSRKNKDATGTKIKRSRPRPEPEPERGPAPKVPRTEPPPDPAPRAPRTEPPPDPAPRAPRMEPPPKNSTITSKDYYTNQMDVETFIKNEKPIDYTNYMNVENFMWMVQPDADKPEVKESVKVNGDKVVNECECESEVNTADYQDAINDIVKNENASEKINDDSVEAQAESDFTVTNDKDNEVNESGIEKTEETIQNVVNNGSKNDLESKIKDLEEKALNKFKGSLLDTIFD